MIVKGQKINLRFPNKKDADSITLHASDIEISEFTFVPHPYQKKDALDFIKRAAQTRDDLIELHFGMENVEDGKLIGMIGLNEINFIHRRAEFGYWLGKKFWGMGIAKEAVKLLTNYCFEKMNLELLYAYVQPENSNSWKLLESCGYQRDGLLRKYMKRGDERLDHYVYSMVRDAWEIYR